MVLDIQNLDTENIVDNAHELISSTRVEGTKVYNKAGEKLGTIHSVMIHKRTGQVAYAVMEFGGFLGVRSHVHPIPWEMLTYNPDLHSYTVDLSREVLEKAPVLQLDEADRPSDRAYDERLYEYYGARVRYWGL